MRKITLFLDELKTVSPEYKKQVTEFILQRAVKPRRGRGKKVNYKLPKGWKLFANRDCVIETEVDANLWLEHFKDK